MPAPSNVSHRPNILPPNLHELDRRYHAWPQRRPDQAQAHDAHSAAATDGNDIDRQWAVARGNAVLASLGSSLRPCYDGVAALTAPAAVGITAFSLSPKVSQGLLPLGRTYRAWGYGSAVVATITLATRLATGRELSMPWSEIGGAFLGTCIVAAAANQLQAGLDFAMPGLCALGTISLAIGIAHQLHHPWAG